MLSRSGKGRIPSCLLWWHREGYRMYQGVRGTGIACTAGPSLLGRCADMRHTAVAELREAVV